jgi:hypothetical protein
VDVGFKRLKPKAPSLSLVAEKPLAVGEFRGNDPAMTKTLLPLAIVATLVSCDSKRESASDKSPDENPRVTRLDRPSRDTPSTRKRLQAALEEARRIEDPAARTEALVGVAREALESEPEVFTEVVLEFPPDSLERAQWIQAGVADYMKRSPEEALAWADSLAEPEAIAMAHGVIAMHLVESEPQRAISLLPRSGNGGFDPAAVPVIHQWTGKAPAEAAAWAANLPAGAARDEGMDAVLTQWVLMDASSAVSWIASLPNPTLREKAMRDAASQLQQQPPFLRDVTLQNLDAGVREELEREIGELQQEQEDAAGMPVE